MIARRILQYVLSVMMLVGGLLPAIVTAQNPSSFDSQPVPILVFVRDECVHCKAEKAFLAQWTENRKDVVVKYYNLADTAALELWKKVTEKAGVSKVTPITVIGKTLIVGFDRAETSGKRIETLVNTAKQEPQVFSSFEELLASQVLVTVDVGGAGCEEGSLIPCADEGLTVSIPFIGIVNLKAYPLIAMALMLGFVDGFNPCAMWVLVTFLILLLKAGSRRKMFQMAGFFILAEAVMYYFILTAWMTAWDFVGLNRIVTPLVGFLAIGGGIFFLWEFITKRGECVVGDLEQKSKTRDRITKLIQSPMTIATAIGILGVAFSVNIFEFACSIGIPQAFTKILDLNAVSWIGKQFLMGAYILMYMVDDLIVFGIALWSFEKIGITTKYSRWCNLIGGVLMLIIGLLLIISPESLVF